MTDLSGLTTAEARAAFLFPHGQSLVDRIPLRWSVTNGFPGPLSDRTPELVQESRQWTAPGIPPVGQDEAVLAAGRTLEAAGFTVTVGESEDTGFVTLRATHLAGKVELMIGPGGCAVGAWTGPAPSDVRDRRRAERSRI